MQRFMRTQRHQPVVPCFRAFSTGCMTTSQKSSSCALVGSLSLGASPFVQPVTQRRYQTEQVHQTEQVRHRYAGAYSKINMTEASYEGDLNEKGERHGKGTYVYGKFRYEGEWREGKMHGEGTMDRAPPSKKVADGAPVVIRYVGQWENDKKHGKGHGEFTNGGFYAGKWKNDKRHGTGTFERRGESYDGKWRADVRHGKGLLTKPGATSATGETTMVESDAEFKDGMCVNQSEWREMKVGVCARHGKARRLGVLKTQPDGSVLCKEGLACQATREEQREKVVCAVHGVSRFRRFMSKQPDGDGFVCSPGADVCKGIAARNAAAVAAGAVPEPAGATAAAPL